MRSNILIYVAVLLVLATFSSQAQIPRTLSYQGILTDSLGHAKPDGVYNFTFRLYSTSSAGTPMWSESKPLNVKQGLFNTYLGEQVPFGAGMKFDAQYWLAIQIGTEAEIPQRIKLSATGYSFSSVRSDTAKFALSAPNADSINGISASRSQLPNALYPLNSEGGISLTFGSFSAGEKFTNNSTDKLAKSPVIPVAVVGVLASAGAAALEIGAGYIVGKGIDAVVSTVTGIGVSGKGGKYGIEGNSDAGSALYGHSISGNGLWASSSTGLAGNFDGNVDVQGQLQTTGFKLTTNAQNGYVLTSDANGIGSWKLASGGGGIGTVTSVIAGTGLTATPSNPITTSGTLSLSSSYQDGSAYDSRFLKLSQNFSGDVTGLYNSTTVGKIQGRTISSNAPSSGQVLKWDGSQWKPDIDITSGGGGTVTSITAGSGLTASPTNPITSSGTLSIASGSITGSMIQDGSITGNDVSTTASFTAQNFYGIGSSNTYGIEGYSSDGARSGIVGSNSNSSGTGIYGVGNGLGVAGGLHATGGSGGSFTGTQYGVAGWSKNTSGLRAGGYFDVNNGQSYAYVGAITSTGTVRKIEGNGTVNTVMKTRSGVKSLFAPESPEAWFEDIGRGQLQTGHIRIDLDPLFLDCTTINESTPLNVFITLNDDCNGVYVRSDNTGFDVFELKSGTTNARFTYKVIAKWKGYEQERFPDAIPRQNAMESLESSIEK